MNSRSRALTRILPGLGLLFGLGLVTASAWGQSPLTTAEQQRVLQTVTEFARSYIAGLPDFTCIRTTEHWLTPRSTKQWKAQAKVAYELSYHNQRENYQVVSVDAVPKKKIPLSAMLGGWFDAPGTFDSMVRDIFDPDSHARFEWYRWDAIETKPAYVFSYHVALADSKAATGKCTSFIVFTNCKAFRYAYHGLAYVDVGSLDILRLTQVPDDVPTSQVQFSFSVDYGRVMVAGQEYVLPIADHVEGSSGSTLFRNESTFGSYKKFVAEANLTTTITPATEGTPAKPIAKAAAPKPQPVDSPDCFKLRDEAARAGASSLTRAIEAAAFHDFGRAEKEFLAVIRAHPDSDEAFKAHAELAWMEQLSGHSQKALDQSVAEKPALLEALAKFPEQAVTARVYSRVPYVRQEGEITIAAAVNGNMAQLQLDTGAGLSTISASQATSLGLTIHDDRFSMADVDGKEILCRVGLAGELSVGGFRVKNVPFCVADQFPSQSHGILGLPVMLAFETIRWSRDGTFELGFPSGRIDTPRSNLCFENGGLVVNVDVNLDSSQKHLPFNFDTGNAHTFLYTEFGEDFAGAAKAAGEKDTFEIAGLGGRAEREAVELPDMRFGMAGLDSVLHEVPMLAEPQESRCPGCYGNAGTDLLDQAKTVTLDFKAMRLTVQR